MQSEDTVSFWMLDVWIAFIDVSFFLLLILMTFLEPLLVIVMFLEEVLTTVLRETLLLLAPATIQFLKMHGFSNLKSQF